MQFRSKAWGGEGTGEVKEAFSLQSKENTTFAKGFGGGENGEGDGVWGMCVNLGREGQGEFKNKTKNRAKINARKLPHAWSTVATCHGGSAA